MSDEGLTRPQAIYARFHGFINGEYIPGIPARHLTKDDWFRLDEDLRKKAQETGLYELPKKKPAAKKTTKPAASKRKAPAKKTNKKEGE